MNAFRSLNKNERHAITCANAKGKIPETHLLVSAIELAKVSYENMQGGFCVCIIIVDHTVTDNNFPRGTSVSGTKTTRYIFRGASRRSYKDPRKPIRGEMLAFSRAILYSRAVELS